MYSRFIRELKDGRLKIDMKAVRSDEKLDGKFLVSCTDPSLSAADVALGYKQLWQIEYGFRTLKSTLDLRPVYHRRKDRIKSHVLLCWLALLLIRVIENKTGATWSWIRDELSEMHRVNLVNKNQVVSMTTRLTSAQRKILQSLEIKGPASVQSIKSLA